MNRTVFHQKAHQMSLHGDNSESIRQVNIKETRFMDATIAYNAGWVG